MTLNEQTEIMSLFLDDLKDYEQISQILDIKCSKVKHLIYKRLDCFIRERTIKMIMLKRCKERHLK